MGNGNNFSKYPNFIHLSNVRLDITIEPCWVTNWLLAAVQLQMFTQSKKYTKYVSTFQVLFSCIVNVSIFQFSEVNNCICIDFLCLNCNHMYIKREMLKFPQTKLSVANTLSRISHPPICSVYLYSPSHQPSFNFVLSFMPCQYIVVN